MQRYELIHTYTDINKHYQKLNKHYNPTTKTILQKNIIYKHARTHERTHVQTRERTYVPECRNEPAAAFLAVEKTVSFFNIFKSFIAMKSFCEI